MAGRRWDASAHGSLPPPDRVDQVVDLRLQLCVTQKAIMVIVLIAVTPARGKKAANGDEAVVAMARGQPITDGRFAYYVQPMAKSSPDELDPASGRRLL